MPERKVSRSAAVSRDMGGDGNKSEMCARGLRRLSEEQMK